MGIITGGVNRQAVLLSDPHMQAGWAETESGAVCLKRRQREYDVL